MKQAIIILVITLGFFSSCKKNPFWVGNKEFITYEYKFSEGSLPEISTEPVDRSPFVEVSSSSATQMSNDVVKITVEGIRVFSDKKNFVIDEITISENDGNGWDVQNEFSSINSSENLDTDVAAVLVLDMSSSLADLIPDLKLYANEFRFHSADNAAALKAKVNDFNMSEDRTALFEATKRGIALLDDLTDFDGEKTLVVFTDGGDNDTDNPNQVKDLINDCEYFRICIGLKGSDFDEDDLRSIASRKSNAITVKDEGDLRDAFVDVAGTVSSVYTIQYERSDQILDEPIEIKFDFKVSKI